MYKHYIPQTNTVNSFSKWEDFRKTIPVYYAKLKITVADLASHIDASIASQIDDFLKDAMDTPNLALDSSYHYFSTCTLEQYNKAVLGKEKGINKAYLDQIKWKWKNPSTVMIVCYLNMSKFTDGSYRLDIYGLHSVVDDKDPEMKYICHKLIRIDMIDSAIS